MNPTDPLPNSTEQGVSGVEYALLVAFIATVIIGTVIIFGGEVADLFERVNWWG